MLEGIKLSNILFLDIETVPQSPDFSGLSEEMQYLWDDKTQYQRGEETAAEFYGKRAGIMAEFSKIICISVGFITEEEDGLKGFRLKSFSGDNEQDLLIEFAELLENHYSSPNHLLCAHNGKEFDFPVIARRMLVNGIRLPKLLNIAGKKPWEIQHLDTMELWKFGDWKNYTSLKLLAAIFNIPTPKDDIDGSQVAEVYWKEQNLPRIVEYCQKDTLTVAQLLLKYKGLPIIKPENVKV